MTKDFEIKLLDRLIARHKGNSYIGDFLAANREKIVYAIRQDLPIDAVIGFEHVYEREQGR